MPLKFFFNKSDPQKELVRQALEQARDVRADFNMDLFLDKRLVLQIQGICAEVGSDFVRVYLRSDNSYLPPVGSKAHVYFTLRKDHVNVPYDFSCEITRAEQRGRDLFLLLSMPEKLGNNQRRYNVRISASKDDIAHFRVWVNQGEPSASAPDAGAAASATAKSRGKQDWQPFDDADIQLLDISAGGLQFGVRTSSPLHPRLALREKLLVGGTFDFKDKPSQQLIMAGTVSRVVSDESYLITRVGLRFRRWVSVKDKQRQWFPVHATEGVPPLASWVLQTILARNRSDRNAAAE